MHIGSNFRQFPCGTFPGFASFALGMKGSESFGERVVVDLRYEDEMCIFGADVVG